ncbi:hypothetical protein MBLNU457_4230t1 [Dothideomycetes sp. NU457]
MRRFSPTGAQIALVLFVCTCFWFVGYSTHQQNTEWSVSQALKDGRRTVGSAALKAQNALMESYQSAATDLAGYESAMATQMPTSTSDTVQAEPTSEPQNYDKGAHYNTQPKPDPIPESEPAHNAPKPQDEDRRGPSNAGIEFPQSVEQNQEGEKASSDKDDGTSTVYPWEADNADSTTDDPATPSATSIKPINPDLNEKAAEILNWIKTPDDALDESHDRLRCPGVVEGRYDYMKTHGKKEVMQLQRGGAKTYKVKPKYFFALDLYNCAPVLSRLLSTIVDAIQFLGPENCALSVVEGRSEDGTYEVLLGMRPILEKMGTHFFIQTNETNPHEIDDVDFKERIVRLAVLRNMALEPLTSQPENFHSDTIVFFINDVSLCVSDVLELGHQIIMQNAHMTCAMDWIQDGHNFYDSWIGRTMKGDLFIWQSESGDFSHHAQTLFWNDANLKARRENGLAFQVFSCWNGGVAFTAKPLVEHGVRFRTHHQGECHLGEPVHFAKDFRQVGYDRVAVVGSVNVGYNDADTRAAKDRWGNVQDWTTQRWLAEMKMQGISEKIRWDPNPPDKIMCIEMWGADAHYVDWDEPRAKIEAGESLD